MFRQLIYLVSFVLVLGLVNTSVVSGVDLDTDPSLVGWWKFDEGSGNTAMDSSGNGYDIPLPDTTTWEDGLFGGALHFHGVGAGSLGNFRYSDNAITVCAWVWHDAFRGGNELYVVVTPQVAVIERQQDGQLRFRISTDGIIRHLRVFSDVLKEGQWHHVAGTWDGLTQRLYLDGMEIASQAPGGVLDSTTMIRISYLGGPLNGMLDDVRVYNRGLSSREIMFLFDPTADAKTSEPIPADEATDVLRDVVLSWTPGEYAPAVNGHKVYLSENFDDVNDGIGGITQSVSSYDPPGRLDFGKTYYWRVDEANSVSGWDQGNVWQFTIEPFSSPIEDVNATASSSNVINEGPENTINSSGLDADDLHSDDSKTMWLSSTIGPQPAWIQYELDQVYKLHQMLVWNYNTSLELVIGFGIKEATIEYSVDGTSWTTLGTTHEFNQALGAAGYAANTTVDLSDVVAKYIKITANSNWGGFMPQFGLSEVRFFYVPVWAKEPNPDSGTTDMDVDNVTLSWRAGREAASHEVQLSDSNQAVIDGTALVATVSEASYDTGELQLNQNYYWKIVEVNEAETPTTWKGNVWNFTTREFLVVDDFEDYNNSSPHRVFQRWIDGVGYSADEFFPVDNPGNGSGAALGHDIWSYDSPHYDGDIMETAIVHGGTQSAPLYYDNSIAPFTSEIVRTFDVPQDWTKHGIKALTLYFYGDPNNVAQQMYVKLNGVKVLYDGDATNITLKPWQAWNIDLADFAGVDPAPVAGVGADLSNVTELIIGFERIGAIGGSGVVYFDDISLYPYSRELITPAEPDTANLVAHYEFEGTANDSSGNNRHGTVVGDPIFVAGKVGQAISLDGIGDYVEITGYKGILGPNAVTVTAWIKTTATETGTIVNWGTQSNTQRVDFRVNANRLRLAPGGGNVQGDTNVNDGAWHHVAVTVQENATISYPDVILWLDGIDDTRPGTDPDMFNIIANVDVSIGCRATNNDLFFMGQIDDVRIYDRVLSQEDVAWLAGRTQPFDKPF